jgi:hypothetical protein
MILMPNRSVLSTMIPGDWPLGHLKNVLTKGVALDERLIASVRPSGNDEIDILFDQEVEEARRRAQGGERRAMFYVLKHRYGGYGKYGIVSGSFMEYWRTTHDQALRKAFNGLRALPDGTLSFTEGEPVMTVHELFFASPYEVEKPSRKGGSAPVEKDIERKARRLGFIDRTAQSPRGSEWTLKAGALSTLCEIYVEFRGGVEASGRA